MTGQNGINANTNEGFQNAMLNDGINGIRSDINGISTQLCNGFAGVEQGANARQMADMQQNFAMQTAITGGISNLASQQAECLKKIFNKAKEIFGFTYEAVGTYA